jgi:prepilin-type N-terminal cleavage/methylation domain-containing protein
MHANRRSGRARGFTLVELIVSIAIIAIAAVAVLGVLSSVATRSAQSAVQAQATQIACAYLSEVLLRSFADPDANPIEPARYQFDDVGDYNGLVNVGVRDQYNNPVAGLTQYTVTVQVATPPAGSLAAVSPAEMRLVTVTVVHTTGVTVVLSGYRTAYP